jgi:FtsP/CotA-like multicopper oxidase with cupredoxin domain/putative cell wall-binding protein
MSHRVLRRASWTKISIVFFVVFAAVMTVVALGMGETEAAPAGPTDQSKVPHYFGPYPNWALSPLTLPDVAVAIAGDGTGATAAATVGANGAVTGITITSPGANYTAATVSITGAGTGATAAAVVTLSGLVTNITLDTPGAGYKSPVATITGGGATSVATATAYGGVDAVTLGAPGSAYTNPTVDFDLPDAPDGVQASAHATFDPGTGAITGVVVDNPGAGYSTAPSMIIRDGTIFDPIISGGSGASATATLSLTSIALDTYGAGYTSVPAVAITDATGAGAGAGATAFTDVGGVTAVNITAAGSGYVTAGGIKKFQDVLPGLCDPKAGWTNCTDNNLGQHIPLAVADTSTFSTVKGFAADADYYVIAVVQHREQMSSSLPGTGTLLREYVQLETPANAAYSKHIALQTDLLDGTSVPTLMPDGTQAYAVDDPHYLGPIITATKDKPVRVVFYNLLPTGAEGDLFIPVDSTMMGSGMGPMDMMAPMDMGSVLDEIRNPVCSEYPKADGCFKDNRATIHLHGGNTPWISDGTPHQWITPANQTTPWPQGVSVAEVPDMANVPGVPNCSADNDGCQTFYYTNEQSARLLFYHDHSWGITRLNVYAGEAAGYLITDPTEQSLISRGLIPADEIPLIIQDRTFVPSDAQLAAQDPTWDKTRWGSLGDLWYHHVYMPAQNPGDPSGMSAYGRWMYGPWFWPPATTALYQPIANPYYDPACNIDDPTTWQYQTDPFCEPELIPGTPNISVGMEQFNDTPVVNGTAYPTTTVQPKTYRFRVLNAANDRFWNLQWYVADPTTGTLSEVALNPGELAAAQTDPNVVPTPNTTLSPAGPSWIQIGTEGGFLPAPVVVPNQPITWIIDPTRFDVGNVDKHSLLLAPAERADVIVDFSKYAGKTLILYNDAPAAFPARVATYDYYLGAPDMSPVGAPTILPGYGPNTRTIMQVKVAATTPAPTFNLAALQTAFRHHANGSGVFESSQNPIIVGQAAYNSAYGTNFATSSWCNAPGSTSTRCDGYARISEQGGDLFGFNTLKTPNTKLSIPLQPKALHDEMNAASFDEFGRMTANLGLEAVPATPAAQSIILYPFVNPSTELIDATDLPTADVKVTPIGSADGTQIWKITHNGVDTHPIHFHLYDVQIVNRVTWDNIIIPPDATELGWKDTIRVSPLEDTIVAIRPIIPTFPFEVPNSIRELNPMMPLGSTAMFNNVDASANPTAPITNRLVNFGWEYMYHCHILSHEEMDMMRPVSVAMPPYTPDGLAGIPGSPTSLTLYWNDTSISETSFVIQKSADGTAWNDVTAIDSPLDVANTHGTRTYVDGTFTATSPLYRVIAKNLVGYGGEFMSLTVQSVSASVAAGALPPPPTVTGLRPTGGTVDGGTTVVITGTNFVGMIAPNAVTFDGVNATSYVVDSTTQITAVSPPHSIGTVQVQVNAIGGSSTDTPADDYTYANIPAVTRVNPTMGPVAGGTAVTLTGINFADVTAVTFGGFNATGYTVDTPTQITATAPAHISGTVQVQVATLAGLSLDTPGDNYTYLDPPTITLVTPRYGPLSGGTSVTIHGTNFAGMTAPDAVTFGGVNATSYTVVTSAMIVATAPAHAAGLVQVQVTTPGGVTTDTASDDFTYLPVPTITAVTPNMGPLGGGNTVTITGTDFAGMTAPAAVTFDGINATTYTVDTPTQITATAPAHAAGVVQVQVTTPGGATANTAADDYTYIPAPTVTAVTPIQGPAGGGMVVIITGTEFTGMTAPAAVTFGGTNATTYTVDTPTQITATAPAHPAGLVQVQVATPGGTSPNTPADDYTYLPPPTVTAVSPTGGPVAGGTVVTITGANFANMSGPSAVTFGGTNATTYTVDTPTQITATTPAHASGVVQVQVTSLGGASTNTPADDYAYGIIYTSIRGTDRYDTAIRISKAMFTGALPAGSGLVLAPGTTYQEALCGAPLAAAYGGPVLLTATAGLNPAVRAEILRLNPGFVVCIGLSDAIKNAVQTALPTATVTAIRGSAGSVYDMSRQVANALKTKMGGLSTATAIITRGDSFPDATSVSPLAAAKKWPILLTGSSTTLNLSTRLALGELGITKAIKVGTYAALPTTVAGLANLSGGNRYQTNVNLANWAKANAGLTFADIGIAPGTTFPDALAAGPYLAKNNGILLLTPVAGPLPAPIAAAITANRLAVRRVTFLAVVEPVLTQVKALLP